MTMQDFSPPSHDHVFLAKDHWRNERKVWLVIALTASMMGIEIGAGAIYGSMALVADGWHMSTHAAAMLVSALAYFYARRHAHDRRFTFGTGKFGDLAGFTSAILLALVALSIAYQSMMRLFEPVAINFDEATAVATLGLIVNLVSARLLSADHAYCAHTHEHRRDHGYSDRDHRHGAPKGHGVDNSLRAAHIHVLADALTSVLAIVALLLGRFQGWLWADPVIGVIGALAIAHWSWGLIRDAGAVLLDSREMRNWRMTSASRSGTRMRASRTCMFGGSGRGIMPQSLRSPSQSRSACPFTRIASIIFMNSRM